MLTSLTRHHLAACTCHRCGTTLGRFHVYCLTQPAEVLRQTTEFGPMHLECAQEYAEAAHRTELKAQPTFEPALLYALYVVKGSPTAASAKIIRLLKDDPATTQLHLFTPDRIEFHHQTIDGAQAITRPAEYDEIQATMMPAVSELLAACQSPAETEELELQIARLHQYLPKRQPLPRQSGQ